MSGAPDVDAHSIFVCYRRADTAAAAGRLRDRLETSFGAKAIFMDTYEVPAGVDFRIYTRAVLERARVVLVIIGRSWLLAKDAQGASRWADPEDPVHAEIAAALGGRAPIVPVLVDGATMPRADELPDGLRQLAFRNAVTVRSDRGFRPDADELVQTIAEWLRRGLDSESSPSALSNPARDVGTLPPEALESSPAIGSWLLRDVTYSSTNWTSHAVSHRVTGVRATLSVLKPRGYMGGRAAFVLAAARLMSGLDHPALTPVLDWGKTQERAFVVLGSTTTTLVECLTQNGPVDEIRALRWISRLAEGLAHLHANSVVHQLVSPASVQLAAISEPPALGWPMYGVRAGAPLVDAQGEDQVAIVPLTAAPESFNRGGTIEPAADLYGLGLVLYFALTCAFPYSDENIMALIVAKGKPAPDVRVLAPSVSGPTAALVESLLDPDPARRPTATGVSATCERIIRRLAAP